ncbi:MAG TPA: hypothetical protein VHV10_14355 [Ktedonobacteraceae bacterium]|nr:hypothetical protein [Ktedonobacteraceae bacterium]
MRKFAHSGPQRRRDKHPVWALMQQSFAQGHKSGSVTATKRV